MNIRRAVNEHLATLLILLLLGLVYIFLIFLALPNQWVSQDFINNIQSELFGIIFTIIIIDGIITWNESRIWRKVKNIVEQDLNIELNKTIVDIINYTNLPPNIMFFGIPANASPEIMEEIYRNNFFDKYNYILNGNATSLGVLNTLVKKNAYGSLFDKRKENLSDIMLIYGKYLTPELIVIIHNLQRTLYNLNLVIRNYQKYLMNNWTPFMTPQQFNDLIIRTFTEIFELIEESRGHGTIVYIN